MPQREPKGKRGKKGKRHGGSDNAQAATSNNSSLNSRSGLADTLVEDPLVVHSDLMQDLTDKMAETKIFAERAAKPERKHR